MYLTTRALLTERTLAIPQRPESAQGTDGRWYSKYGLGQTAVQAPFFVAGRVLGRLAGATDDRAERFAVGMVNSAVTVVLAALFWLTLRALGTGRGPATVATLIFGLATLAWPYARSDFSEPLQASGVLLALYAAIRWRRRPGAGWAILVGGAAGLAFMTKAASAVILAPVGLYFLVALSAAARPGRAPPAGADPVGRGAVRRLRPRPGRSQPGPLRQPDRVRLRRRAPHRLHHPAGDRDRLPAAQSGEGPVPVRPPGAARNRRSGLAGPPARRSKRRSATLVFLAELTYFGRWWAWHGDWCWGPRYLVVTVPFLMLGWGPLLNAWPALNVSLKALAGALVAAGLAASVLGVVVDYGAYFSVAGAQLGRGVDVQDARQVPQFSPLLGHAWLARATLYETALGQRGGQDGEGADAARPENPFTWDYPWRSAYPELRPGDPTRAFGFDLCVRRPAGAHAVPGVLVGHDRHLAHPGVDPSGRRPPGGGAHAGRGPGAPAGRARPRPGRRRPRPPRRGWRDHPAGRRPGGRAGRLRRERRWRRRRSG